MRLSISKSKNCTSYYVADSRREGKKIITKLIYKIGTHEQLLKEGRDPEAYAKEVVEKFNRESKESIIHINEKIDTKEKLEIKDEVSKQTYRNIGYLYLQSLLKQLKMDEFWANVQTNSKFNSYYIFSALTVSRFLFPNSKKATFENLKNLIGTFNFSLQDCYRFLTLLDKNSDDLQKHLFENSKNIVKTDTTVLYYDCTNYYTEIEYEDDDIFNDDGDVIQYGLRKYGASKEHRPNPIVQMGLFTDKNGIPISYCISHGSNNEQNTTIPLESRMIRDYNTSKFIYCSDGGLGSFDNRFFNTLQGRDYIVTQSLKKTAESELNMIFKDLNWKSFKTDKKISLAKFKEILDKKYNGETLSPEEESYISEDMIYKKYPFKRNVPAKFLQNLNIKIKGKLEMEETLYITFSAKYYLYQKTIFDRQLGAALNNVKRNPENLKYGPNDIRRFIKIISTTSNGEVAPNRSYIIDEELVEKERKFHGFYAVATSLDATVQEVFAINCERWKIEESFRILKTDFNARPIFLQSPEHIRAHFAICFTTILMYRILESKLKESNNKICVSPSKLINQIKCMNVQNHNEKYFESLYTGSALLKELESIFNLGLDKKTYLLKYFEKVFDKIQ